jgi:hypothetical protein
VSVYAFDLVDVFWSMLWFFLFFMWIYLFVVLLTDIFRSHDLSGWGKAMWVVLMIVLPLLGALLYLVVRGDGIAERQLAVAQRQEAGIRGYGQDVATTSGFSTADELAKLADLHARGLLSDEEFERQRARVLA